jgi:hypothetical protein
MDTMGINTLKSNLTDVQRAYLWDIVIPSPIGSGDWAALQARCQATELPPRKTGVIKVPYKQTPGANYHGKLDVGQTWKCTFIEGLDKKVYDACYSWHELVVAVRNGISSGDQEIKTDVYVMMLDGNGNITTQVKLVGAYIEEIGQVTLDYENENPVRFDVTWRFDYHEKVS